MLGPVQVGDRLRFKFHEQTGTKPYNGTVSRTWNGGHQFQLEDARFEIIDPRIHLTEGKE